MHLNYFLNTPSICIFFLFKCHFGLPINSLDSIWSFYFKTKRSKFTLFFLIMQCDCHTPTWMPSVLDVIGFNLFISPQHAQRFFFFFRNAQQFLHYNKSCVSKTCLNKSCAMLFYLCYHLCSSSITRVHILDSPNFAILLILANMSLAVFPLNIYL